MSVRKGRIAALLALAAATAVAYAHRGWFEAALLEEWIATAGWMGPIAYILAYAVATVLFLPGSVFTLAGGALFGAALGTVYSLTGATLGAGASFLIARYLAAGWVARTAGGRLSQVLGGVEAEGWRFVAFARLMPIFPFNLLNYALGLTRISFRGYIAATAIFMVPGALAYSWLGYAGREALGGGEGLVLKALIALALVAAVAFLPRLVRRLRAGKAGDAALMPGPGDLTAAELARRLACRDAIPVLDVRPAAAYGGELGHIAGSLNIPLEQLPLRLPELERFRDSPLAVICRTNRMSGQAVGLLRQLGFNGVFLVTDGMLGWHRLHGGRDAGAPLAASKSPSPS